MNIIQLANASYPRVSIEEKTCFAKNLLKQSPLIMVLDQSSTVVALVSRSSILDAELLSECSLNSFVVGGNMTIADAYRIMSQQQLDAVRVQGGDGFLGVVTLVDLTGHLLKELMRYKKVVQHLGHDMKNSIANLTGLNGLLERNLEKPENIELLRLAKHSCDHANSILRELLFVEKLGDGVYAFETTELNGFIQECAEEMKGILITKDIALDVSISETPFSYDTDRSYLKRVVHNLLSNAFKFSQPGTTVQVFTQVEDEHFILAVCDQGIGIPAEKQPYVFDRFTPLSRAGTQGEASTGLGMYFSKTCIEKLGGKLSFESSEENGTTFFVEFGHK